MGFNTMLSKDQLMAMASKKGYRIEIVEKVVLLSQLLEHIFKSPLLDKSLALKGGTALNLFYFKGLPRLSIDIDLNYIKPVDKETLSQERDLVEDALTRVCGQLNYRIKRHPKSHAGGKMTLFYDGALNNTGKLELDLNYMYRSPIFEVQRMDSHDWPYQIKDIPIIDIHELIAGKLHALFTRTAARDLFDIHHLLSSCKFDRQKLRMVFILYVAMSKVHWKDFNLGNIDFDIVDIRNKLIPVIKKDAIAERSEKSLKIWAKTLLDEVRSKLEDLLFPFTDNELKFLGEIHEHGKINSELICNDKALIKRINSHPNLIWRVLVRKENEKQ